MSALKVQTAPGVWTVVGGQAPGLDQAAADLRYVKLGGDTMTGRLIMQATGLTVHGDYSLEFKDLTGATRRGTIVALADRLTIHADDTLPILFEAGGAEQMRIADSGRVTMSSHLVVNSTATNMAISVGPGTAGVERYIQGTGPNGRIGYLTFLDPGASTGHGVRIAVDENRGDLYLRHGLVDRVKISATQVSVGPGLHINRLAQIWSANDTANVSFYNKSTSADALGARLGWIGVASGENAMFLTNEGGDHLRLTSGTGAIMFATAALPNMAHGTERARIDTVGNLLVAHISTADYATKAGNELRSTGMCVSTVAAASTYNFWGLHVSAADVAGNSFATFRRGSGTPTQIGSIGQVATTGVAYNTTSHGPFKGNVADIEDDTALARIEALRPVTYQWKLDAQGNQREDGTPTGDVQTGFIAQELATVAPEAVTEGYGTQAEWDAWAARREAAAALAVAAAEAGEPEPPEARFEDPEPFAPWMTDVSKLVPALTAAVRALIHKVAALEATP